MVQRNIPDSHNAEELALALDMALSIGRRQPDPARFHANQEG